MRSVKVFYEGGFKNTVSINGTDKDIRDYFQIGKVFNIGYGEHDKLARVEKVIIDPDKLNSSDLTNVERYVSLICRNIESLAQMFDEQSEKADAINEIISRLFPFNKSLDELSKDCEIWKEDVLNKVETLRNKV